MAHRALVAVEREPGEFDCYRSQWGGLAPLTDDPDAAVDAAVARGQPPATGASAAAVLELLDPQADEALLVRSGGETTAYLVRWLGIPTAAGDAEGPVVLVPVAEPAAAERLDVALRTAKGVLGDAVDAGLVPPRAAVRYLESMVARHPDAPAGTVWLDGGGGSGGIR